MPQPQSPQTPIYEIRNISIPPDNNPAGCWLTEVWVVATFRQARFMRLAPDGTEQAKVMLENIKPAFDSILIAEAEFKRAMRQFATTKTDALNSELPILGERVKNARRELLRGFADSEIIAIDDPDPVYAPDEAWFN